MRKKITGAIEATDVFEPLPKITFDVDDDGLTVFDARGGTYWRGNTTAADVMVSVQQKLEVGKVIGRIAEAYGVEPQRVRKDVHALLGELQKFGIVRRVKP